MLVLTNRGEGQHSKAVLLCISTTDRSTGRVITCMTASETKPHKLEVNIAVFTPYTQQVPQYNTPLHPHHTLLKPVHTHTHTKLINTCGNKYTLLN